MRTYGTAQICLNGHVITTEADYSPEFCQKFCSQCGEPTITQCPHCRTNIRGDYHVDGVFFGGHYIRPAFCYNCGKAFPWTEQTIASAVELVKLTEELTSEEIQQFQTDLNELTKDSPKAQVAAVRFKKIMGKIGTVTASAVRDIVVDIISEAIKKNIWG